jgi:DNA-binding GntR family transcriptional regulator
MLDTGALASDIPRKIAEEVREQVARGVLAPGLRLGQAELAEQFDASRMPVREALKLLSAEGIVVHDPNRGFFVAKLSSDEARQLFKMRDLIEDALLAGVRWPTAEELADLEHRAEELEDLLNAGARGGWWIRHREFHRIVFELSDEKIIVNEAMRLWSLTDRYRSLLPLPRRLSPERSVVNKHNLVQALEDKDRRQLLSVRAERRQYFEQLVLETLESRGL